METFLLFFTQNCCDDGRSNAFITFSPNFASIIKRISANWFISIPLEIIRKPEVFIGFSFYFFRGTFWENTWMGCSTVPICKGGGSVKFYFWTNFTNHFTLCSIWSVWKKQSPFNEFKQIPSTHPLLLPAPYNQYLCSYWVVQLCFFYIACQYFKKLTRLAP